MLAFGLTISAGAIWTFLLLLNMATSPTIPWSVVVTGFLLWLTWRYLGGWGAPASTSATRRSYLRAGPVSGTVFAWAAVAGTLSIAALAGLWTVLHQLVRVPGNSLPDFSRYPLLTVAGVVFMASLVNSVGEEAGFRGYFQVALERNIAAPIAIFVMALVMAPAHALTQGFVWPTLVFYFFVDVMFGVTAYLTGSIVPGILVHTVGLVVFFTLVWPFDATRQLVGEGGADTGFWLRVVLMAVCAALAVLAFMRLARVTGRVGSVERSAYV
jgi:membrane protease YdiL (CAAX protease family)